MTQDNRKTQTTSRRGATGIAYGLMVGLISVVALGAITSSGNSIVELFGTTGEQLGSAGSAVSLPPSPSPSPQEATLAVSPDTSAGMDISGGSSPGTPVTFTFSNSGDLPTASLTTSLTGDSGNFSITTDGCDGNTLSGGQSCDVTVEPVATTNTSYSADLGVSDGALTATASLSGTASGFPYGTCKDLYDGGTTSSGLYTIDPDGPGGNAAHQAYCNMSDAGGGWTLCTYYSGSDSTTIASIAGNWGSDPSSRSSTGSRSCSELLAASSTQEALVRTSTGYMIRYQGITSAFNNSYSSHEFVNWPGNLTGQTPLFNASGSQEHWFGMRDLDYNFGATCGNYSPNYYQISIDKQYNVNSGSCGSTNWTSNVVEFGIFDRENCNLCTCNWTSCWSGKSAPNVELYIR